MKPLHAVLLAAAVAMTSAHASTVVSNLSAPTGAGGLTIINGISSGQAFSTPASGPGWYLNSLVFTLREQTTTNGPLTVGIYSNASGNPGTLLATLTGTNPSGTTYTNYTFTPAASLTLNANTIYFAVLSTTSTTSYLWLERDASEVGDPGWAISDVTRRDLGAPFDGAPVSLAVNATAVPEPSAALLSLAGLGSMLFRRRR